MFSDLEKQWDAAVLRKPGPGETAEQVAEEQEPARFGIEVELVDEELEQEILAGQGEVDQIEPDLDELAAGVDRLGANVANLREQLQQAQGDEAAREAMRQAHREAQAAVRRRGAARRVLDIQHNLTYTKVIGALFFPTISSVMGRLLLYTMPSSWTSKLGSKVSKGLLKETWGRNLIGGCLFVVLKDAVTLYCKWRKARDFSTLKILDYVGERRQA
jgi:outer membrane murein-binding lipoprotein Lpp